MQRSHHVAIYSLCLPFQEIGGVTFDARVLSLVGAKVMVFMCCGPRDSPSENVMKIGNSIRKSPGGLFEFELGKEGFYDEKSRVLVKKYSSEVADVRLVVDEIIRRTEERHTAPVYLTAVSLTHNGEDVGRIDTETEVGTDSARVKIGIRPVRRRSVQYKQPNTRRYGLGAGDDRDHQRGDDIWGRQLNVLCTEWRNELRTRAGVSRNLQRKDLRELVSMIPSFLTITCKLRSQASSVTRGVISYHRFFNLSEFHFMAPAYKYHDGAAVAQLNHIREKRATHRHPRHGRRVNRIVGVATLAVTVGRYAIVECIYSLFIVECTVWRWIATLYNGIDIVKMYTVVNSTIEPIEKGVSQSLAHGDASPHRTHYYLWTVYIYSIAWRHVATHRTQFYLKMYNFLFRALKSLKGLLRGVPLAFSNLSLPFDEKAKLLEGSREGRSEKNSETH
ncbi:hypothetical protein EVAR_97580_1 [Eumeta japonica]|uniref:Uncharacterized protein n=1 Tax=Eumeta variegata TaxID=151549 RepID=A0A4C1WS81_EUMVA|nr:hypothetical protein EVAR_97580_1 [Eumeta japonica]